MPEAVFRFVLPLFWLGLVLGIAGNRWRVKRQVGHDPIVLRPWRKPDGPAGYLERALSLGTLALTVDVALNAITPDRIAHALGISALRSSWVIGCFGLVLLTVGFLIAAVAVTQMGTSWRIGIDHRAPGPLVARGLFGRVRHPIYGGMLLATTGVAALTADALSIAVAAAAAVGIPVQARLEEAFLSSRYPQEYPGYMERTGRFWPKVR